MWRERRHWLWCVWLAGWLLVLGWPQAALAQPPLSWSGPSSAVGDGQTPVVLNLVTQAPDSVILSRLEVIASAGKILHPRASDPGHYEFDFIPPRVVEQTRVTIEARVRGGPTAQPLTIDVKPVLAAPAVRTSSGPLALQVPQRLILGHDPSGPISVRQTEGAPPILTVSVGSVTEWQPGPEGRLVATYTPPAEKYPQLVIVVAATPDGGLVDWSVIQLYGTPLVSTTSEPNAAVRVRVADVEYGPVRTDRRGKARMRVLAPPGVTLAFALARDSVGNESNVPLRLGVPEFVRSLAVCPRESGQLLYFALDPDGQPRKQLKLDVSTSLGTLTQPEQQPDGYYRAELVVPDEAAYGDAVEFSVQVASEEASRTSCQTQVPGERPEGMTLALSQPVYRSGTASPVKLLASLKFPGKRQPRSVPLKIEVELGETTKPEQVSPTQYAMTWTLPENFGGRGHAVVRVTTASLPLLQAEQTLQLEPGPLARLDLSCDQDEVWADGQSRAQLTVRASDAAGNAVPGVQLLPQALGRVEPFVEQSAGVYVAAYVAPESRGGTETVTVRDGQGRAQSTLCIRLLPGQRLYGWVRAGYLSNFARVSGPLLAGGMGTRLPVLDGGLMAGVELSYYSSRSVDRDATGLEDVTVAVSVLPLSARLTYELPVAPVVPYLGLTAGLAFAHTEVSSESTGTIADDRLLFAISGRGGAATDVGPGRAAIELGYLHSGVDDPRLEGNIGGVELTAGYRLGF